MALEGGKLATEGHAHQNEGMLDVEQESNWVFFASHCHYQKNQGEILEKLESLVKASHLV